MIQSYFFGRNFLRRNWGNWLRLRLRSNRAKAFVTVLFLLLPALSAFALTGYFTPTSEFQAFEVDAVSYPYFELSVTTAPTYTSVSGFSFGLRFLVKLVDGSTALEYNDKLSIEHVPSGTTSVLKVYVLNYDSNIRTIVGIRLYAEERAGIGSNFSIRINSITASSMNRVPFCASSICYVTLTLPNATGSFDTLVADTDIAGQTSYNVAFYYANQTVISRTYHHGGGSCLTGDQSCATFR